MADLINYNGILFSTEEKLFSVNRAMIYGDGLFESIRILNGEIVFLADHIQRLMDGMRALKIEIPESYSYFFFHKQILDLAQKQQVGSNARVRISVFRSGGGLYAPLENAPEYFVQILPMDACFVLNDAPFTIGVFFDVRKDYSTFSFCKTMNALPYVIASVYSLEAGYDDCLLLNSHGVIADATSSNIFWIKNQKVFTPPVSDGGVAGIMRKNLLELLKRNSFVTEEQSVDLNELQQADEIFLTNTAWGIKKVTHLNAVSFRSEITGKIFSLLLNEFA